MAVLGFAGSARANVFWDPANWVQGVSGYSGDWLICLIGDHEFLDKDKTEYAISWIRIYESLDKGQHVEIYGREMGTNPDYDERLGLDSIPNAGLATSHKEVALGTNRYIRAVRACTNNNSNHRLKGLQVKAAYVDSVFGQYWEEDGVADEWDQNNCDDWHQWLTCPFGEVAVGVRLNYEDKAFTGIELKCGHLWW